MQEQSQEVIDDVYKNYKNIITEGIGNVQFQKIMEKYEEKYYGSKSVLKNIEELVLLSHNTSVKSEIPTNNFEIEKIKAKE